MVGVAAMGVAPYQLVRDAGSKATLPVTVGRIIEADAVPRGNIIGMGRHDVPIPCRAASTSFVGVPVDYNTEAVAAASTATRGPASADESGQVATHEQLLFPTP